MNKQKFVEYLRSPDNLNEEQFEEVQQLLVDHPYFSIAKSIAARAAKKLDNEAQGKLITSAAIFATDRKHLKKYINGELIFLNAPPEIKEEKEKASTSSKESTPTSTEPDLTNLTPPAAGDVDQILDELQHDMNALKKSREHFIDIQNQIEDEGSSVSEKTEVPPTVDEVSVPETPEKEDTTVTSEVVSPEKDKAISELVIDLEALKKEFQEEEETNQQKEIDKTDGLGESNDFSAKSVIEEIKREEELRKEESEKSEPDTIQEEQASVDKQETSKKDEAEDLIEISDEEDIEDLTEIPEAPKPSGTPINVVTNMSEADENDEGEPGMFDEGEIPEQKKPVVPKKKKLPARANRDMRKKVKRSDLDSLMGLKSVPKSSATKPTLPSADDLEKEESKSKPKAVNKTPERKKASPAKSKTPTEKKTDSATAKPSLEKKTTKKTTAKSTTAKKATSKRSKTSSGASKSARHIGTPKIEDDPKTASTDPKTGAEEALGDDPVTKATRKAMLDFGKSEGLSMSVSRASPSKRKRSRAGKSKSQDTTKSGGKDDDESGGASSIIDKFLEENPSIKRKVLSDKKKDLSEESTKFQDEIASEYLAEIYTKQGNKLRAIKIYENLSLKFPEKKSYFAGLIQKLK